MDKTNTLFIVPNNDAESLKIQEMLTRENAEFLVTNQAWGASWENLEESIKMSLGNYEKVYGIELQGKPITENCENIDHHKYYKSDEVGNEQKMESAMGQVSHILGIELTTEEKFYEANDTGYIPEMKKLAIKLGLPDEETEKYIDQVNIDEERMQGVTPELKEMARKAVDDAYVYDERLVWVDLPDFKAMRPVTNILYKMGKYSDMLYDTTVIDANDGQGRLVVFGNKEKIVESLSKIYTEGSWSGGNDEYGYFGIQFKNPVQKESISKEIRGYLEEKILGYHRLIEREDILHTENFAPGIHVHELKNSEKFYKAITTAKEGNDHGAFVHAYEKEEYKKMKLFVVNAGAAGMAVKEGDIVSVFKNPDMALKDSIERINNTLLITGIKNGGERLDCFDGFLPELYSKFGFVPCARLKFNDEFAPEGWNFERDGRPNILFMAHNGDSLEEIFKKQEEKSWIKYSEIKDNVPFVEDYEQAVELQTKFLHERDEKSKEMQSEITRKSEIKLR
ncbi:hypothetical protein A2780_00035 [Candidatus Daviesbacteria bacterium RIFCSPHIGHO2_01_FULL_41_45]|nr:MAG: hypothetical protein A2780_00035 [Candidatus Daviesbacteria bacterium RIFCSPHIGHO2_01_FULL_41_45]OGH81534.1 MAG: hypothetical protein A3F93_00630 [Candidatus Magasanikbacteria bacterium RIFCSPLOWO2_12_FULL_34_7]OGN22859.1 MAG: hypothetical protein A2915_01065 [Candidatus Yanofskybacteria bacterium RIFCSPLOWO2_01_FULL_41_34]